MTASTRSIRFQHWLYASGLKSAGGLALPDFLGIGAQKAGTSWLHENLRHHPGAFFPPTKEVHYFDENFDQPLSDYAALFEPAGNRIKGEITPAYGILPADRIEFIRAIMPSVRLIFLIRNPIERAWSAALMMLITQGGRKYDEILPAEFFGQFTSPSNLRRGDYFAILSRWLSVFPREQFFIGSFEDITIRPIELLKSACEHIGLSTSVDWEQFPYRQKVYPGPAIQMPGVYRSFLTDLYRPKIVQLRSLLRSSIDRWLDSPARAH